MSRVASYLSILMTLLLLVACGKPIPKEKLTYVGNWRADRMALNITQDGHVAYKRVEGSTSKTINAPLKSFEGDNFIVGVGPIDTTFVVSVAPHRDEGVWKMTVDGIELYKVQ